LLEPPLLKLLLLCHDRLFTLRTQTTSLLQLLLLLLQHL
jgi:hypothetical protein